MKRITFSEAAKGRFFIVSTALLWGLAGVCVKSIPWSPMTISAMRCLVSALMTAALRRSFKVRLTKATVLSAVFQSLTGLLYITSIKLTTAANAIVLQYIAPILVFIFTAVYKRVRPKLSETLIVLAVFGGCALSFAQDLDATHVLGNLVGLASGISFAAQIIAFADEKTDPAEGVYLACVITFLVSLPFAFFDKNLVFTPKAVFWALVLSVFQYGLANITYAKGCHRIPQVETSLLLTIEPIFNPIPVAFVTGEVPGPLGIAGFFTVISGVTAYSLLPVIRKRKSGAVINKC